MSKDSELLSVPGLSSDAEGETSDSSPGLVKKKSAVDPGALLMRFAGKPIKKEKSQTDNTKGSKEKVSFDGVKSTKRKKSHDSSKVTKGRDTADSSKATKCKDTTDSSKLNGKGKDNTDSPKANKGRNNRKRSSKDLVSKGHTISKEQKTAKTEIEKLSPTDDGTEIPDWYEELDDENLNSFRELFSMLDQSNTGIITADNMYEELRRIDSEITFQEVEDVLKKVDKDGSGTIDFDEFLYHMTQMGDELFEGLLGDEEAKSRYTRRKRLFYSAITQFSIKQTLADLEKTFKKIQAPHVISHYTAGARLIGLTTRQLEQQMKRMQKSAKKNDSPYGQPLQFVHLGTKGIVRKRIKKPTRPVASRALVSPVSVAKEDVKGDDNQDPGEVEILSKEIENHLRLLAQRGSIVAKLPDAHKLLAWRQRIGNVSAQLRSGVERMDSCNLDSVSEEKDEMPVIEEKSKSFLEEPAKPRSLAKSRDNVAFQRSFVIARTADAAKGELKKQGSVKTVPHIGWTTPRIEYLGVPLPSLKMKYKSKKPTFNDLPSIRAKTKNATDIYYRQLRQAEIRNAWEHWDKLYADVIRPKKLLENFRKVYDAYSPHREEESFVVCPWKPGPFLLRSNRRKFTQSLPCTPDFMTGRFCPTIRPLSRL